MFLDGVSSYTNPSELVTLARARGEDTAHERLVLQGVATANRLLLENVSAKHHPLLYHPTLQNLMQNTLDNKSQSSLMQPDIQGQKVSCCTVHASSAMGTEQRLSFTYSCVLTMQFLAC